MKSVLNVSTELGMFYVTVLSTATSMACGWSEDTLMEAKTRAKTGSTHCYTTVAVRKMGARKYNIINIIRFVYSIYLYKIYLLVGSHILFFFVHPSNTKCHNLFLFFQQRFPDQFVS